MKTNNPDICPGCGAAFQDMMPDKAGFLPSGVRRKQDTVCMRCFQLTHYNKASESSISEEDVRSIVKEILPKAAMAVWVVDFSDLAGTLIPEWTTWWGKTPAVLAINKIDLLPERTPVSEFIRKLKRYMRDFPGHPGFYIPVSAKLGMGLQEMSMVFKSQVHPGKSIAFFGATNVGKSSLINAFLRLRGIRGSFTVSSCRSTTQGVIGKRLDQEHWRIVDTPGLISPFRVVDMLCPGCSAALITGKKLQSKLWHLEPGQSLTMGGLATLTHMGPEKRTFIFYTSENTVLHRTNASRLAQFQKDYWKSIMAVPCRACLSSIPQQVEKIILPSDSDLAWPGLGWVSLRGGDAEIQITYPEGTRYQIRPALIGKDLR